MILGLIPLILSLHNSPVIKQSLITEDEYAQRVQDEPCGRIPPATMRGVTCVCKTYPPSLLDIAPYLYTKRVKPWIATKINQLMAKLQPAAGLRKL